MAGLTVYLVVDHKILRRGLAGIIRGFAGVSRVEEASAGADLLQLLRRERPDVIILEYGMPELDGLAFTRNLTATYPEVRLILLTRCAESHLIASFQQGGVHGCITRDSDISEVEQLITQTVSGGVAAGSDLTAGEQIPRGERTPSSAYGQLTDRERQIIEMICDEKTPREIARYLNISEATVHVHKRNVMIKLGVKGNIGILRYALSEGLFRNSRAI